MGNVDQPFLRIPTYLHNEDQGAITICMKTWLIFLLYE